MKTLQPNISFNTNEYDDFENYCTLRETFDPFEMFYENQKYKEVINKAIEYLTSYSSIHTIQFGTENDSLNDIELNKMLDNKSITEMTYRYLKVHDKLLQILDKVKD